MTIETISGFKNKQRGSALILMTVIVSVVMLLLIIGNITLFSRQLANDLPEEKKRYLDKAEILLETWYRKNALNLDNVTGTPGACPVVTEDQIFKGAMLTPDLGARIAITPCLSINGDTVIYRNIAIWIPQFGVQDLAGFSTTPGSGSFNPKSAGTVYRIISGRTIEANMVGETRRVLISVAHALEARFKAKLEADPDHDLNYNYFRAIDCGNVGPEEIPCSAPDSPAVPLKDTGRAGVAAYVALDDAAYAASKLGPLASITPNMIKDAWGQPIIFNNMVDDVGNPCVSSAKDVDHTGPWIPPFTMLLQSITPWGTVINICAVQPTN